LNTRELKLLLFKLTAVGEILGLEIGTTNKIIAEIIVENQWTLITLIRKASSRRFAWWQHEMRVLYVSIPGFTPACFIACTQGEVHKKVNEGKIRTIPAPSILSTSKLH
jgi:hypothetical protein